MQNSGHTDHSKYDTDASVASLRQLADIIRTSGRLGRNTQTSTTPTNVHSKTRFTQAFVVVDDTCRSVTVAGSGESLLAPHSSTTSSPPQS